MHPAQIKASLEIAGVTQAYIADECDCSRAFVGSVIRGDSRSRRVEAALAAAIGKRPAEVWPSWYDRNGRPVRQKRIPSDETVRRVAAAVNGAR